MKRISLNILVFSALVIFFVVLPQYAFAAGLVNCGKAGPINPDGTQACGFPQFIQLISIIMDFLIYVVAPIIAVCVILYAGFLYLTSMGSTENIGKANGLFTKAVVGLVIAMMGWMLVKFILVELGVDTTVFPVFYQ